MGTEGKSWEEIMQELARDFGLTVVVRTEDGCQVYKPEKIVLIEFIDHEDREQRKGYLVRTKLTYGDLSELITEIVWGFEERDFYEWSYEDIIRELENRRVVKRTYHEATPQATYGFIL